MTLKLKTILTESKQVGVLYHFTPIMRLLKIMDGDVLLPSKADGHQGEPFISFTRDRNFRFPAMWKSETMVRIVLDGDKLSNMYTIKPFQFQGSHKYNLPGVGIVAEPVSDEAEERLTFPRKKYPDTDKFIEALHDVRKYIIQIDLPKDIFVLDRLFYTNFSVDVTASQRNHSSTNLSFDKIYADLDTLYKSCIDRKKFSKFKEEHPAGVSSDFGFRIAIKPSNVRYFASEVVDYTKFQTKLSEIESMLSEFFKVPVKCVL